MASDTYAVDPAELDATVSQMQQCELAVERLAADLQHEMTRLQGQWHGEAADAQRAAQAEWQRGLATMRAALTAYRMSARRAHDNYVSAITTNDRMWAQTR